MRSNLENSKAGPSVGQQGATMVEAVIALPLFLFIVFVSIEFMILSWRALTLQFIATQAMRTLVTGMCGVKDGEPVYCDDAQDRINYVERVAGELSISYGLGTNPELELCIRLAGDREGECRNRTGEKSGLTVVGNLVEVQTTYGSSLFFRYIRKENAGSDDQDDSEEFAEKFRLVGISVGRVEGRPRSE